MAGRGFDLGRRAATALLSICLPVVPLVAIAAVSPATADERTPASPGSLEVQLFRQPDLSGQVQHVKLNAAQPYVFLERLGDGEDPVVRSLQAGASVGVVLFQETFFSSEDQGCMPTLGSDDSPDLIWTGATAKFLPAQTGDRGEITWRALDAGDTRGQDYASAIVYLRDHGPPPGALLLKRRRFYSRGCENILRSFNFDRRFVPLDLPAGDPVKTGESMGRNGCVNLRGGAAPKAGAAKTEGPPDMRRSDRIVLLQPSDLDPLYADRDRRYRLVLYDAEDCRGETVSLEAPFASVSKTTDRAVRWLDRRDVLLSSLLFRDRARSLRLERLQPDRNRAARLTSPDSESNPDARIDTAISSTTVLSAGTSTRAGRTQRAGSDQAATSAVLQMAETDRRSPPLSGAVVMTATSDNAFSGQSAALNREPPARSALEPSPVFASGGKPFGSTSRSATDSLELAQPASSPRERSSAQGSSSPESQDGETAGSQVFTFPVYDVYRLNYCLRNDGGCGEPAATEWCRWKGFDRAVAWRKDDNIGGLFPTFLIEDERICAQYNCDGFAEITCSQ